MDAKIETRKVCCPYCGSEKLCRLAHVLSVVSLSEVKVRTGADGSIDCTESEDSVDWDDEQLDYSYDDGYREFVCGMCGHSWDSLEEFVKECDRGGIVKIEM